MTQRDSSGGIGVLSLGVLSLCACAVTNLSVAASPSPAEQAEFNEKLAGQQATVTMRKDDLVEREAVRAVQLDRDGNLALGETERVGPGAREAGSAFEWAYVPASSVIEVRTVDRARGALKGFGIGALVGFLSAGTVTYVANGYCPPNAVCEGNGPGNSLAIGALVGLVVAAITGGIGAGIGAATGDGAVVTFDRAPSSRASAGAAVEP